MDPNKIAAASAKMRRPELRLNPADVGRLANAMVPTTMETEGAACHVVAEMYRAAHGVRWSPSQLVYALHECVSEEGDDSETGRQWTAELEQMQARHDARVAATEGASQ